MKKHITITTNVVVRFAYTKFGRNLIFYISISERIESESRQEVVKGILI